MFGKKSKNETENPEVEENKSVGEKKPEAIERDQTVEGAQKAQEEMAEKGPDHCHILMSAKYKLNLLEINHRTIEEIEKARFRIMAKHDDEKAVEEFKNYVFEKLLTK